VGALLQDRRRLAMQLQDRDTIAGRLESVLSILLHTLSILGYLHIFHVDIASMWFTFSSVLLAMSFVFGNSVRNIYESAIYIFLV
jgi:small-conductance mechanosensitive channel